MDDQIVNPNPVPFVENIVRKHKFVATIFFITTFITLGILATISYFIFTTKGQIVFYRFSPNIQGVLALNSKLTQELASLTAVRQIETTKGDAQIIDKENVSGTAEYQIRLSDSYINASSTVPNTDQLIRKIRITVDGGIYVEDAYDGSYAPIVESSFAIPNIQKVLLITPVSLRQLLLKNEENIHIAYEDSEEEFVLTSLSTIIYQDMRIDSLVVHIDKNYMIQSFKLKFSEIQISKSDIISTNGSFSDYKTSEVPVDTNFSINLFGDFFGRESVHIRTDPLGSKDELWHKWEEKYFECKQCVNIAGDSDGDSLKNIYEFIYGTDPYRVDTNGNGHNDFEDLKNSVHPLLETSIADSYSTSVQIFLYKALNLSEPPDRKRYGVERSSAVHKIFKVSEEIRYLVYEYIYFGNPDSGGYTTLFIDNELVTLLHPTLSQDVQKGIINLEKYSGKEVNLSIVVNSYGIKEVPPESFTFFNIKLVR